MNAACVISSSGAHGRGTLRDPGGYMQPLPRFRTDLEVFEQLESDGSAVVVLKDPVGERFFRLTPHEYRFLSLLNGKRSPVEACQALLERGFVVSAAEAGEILSRADQMGLLLRTGYGTARHLGGIRSRTEDAKRQHRLASLFFFYVPVLNPDRFLERTLWIFRLCANPITAAIALLLAPGALWLLLEDLSHLGQELLFFFTWQGLASLWATTAAVKVVHELGHGYTAKSFGLRVPRMGVAVLMFCPYLYCDTTDAWQLGSRRQRIAISAAGVIVECVLAMFGTYVWHFSRPGLMHSLAFHITAVSLVSTLLVNANPLMKRDGYFVLSDLLDLPNLYQKASNQVRYLWLNVVLGIEAVPAIAHTPFETWVFSLYGIGAAVYKVVIYSGIVTMVYRMFDKTIGIVLAVMAFSLFVVAPTCSGLLSLAGRWRQIRPRPIPAALCLLAFGCGIYGLVQPFRTSAVFPCLVAATRVQQLTVPLAAGLDSVLAQRGSRVRAGDQLFTLDPREFESELAKKRLERSILLLEYEQLLLDSEHKARAPMKLNAIEQAAEEIRRLGEKVELARNGFRAPFDAVVTRLDPRVQPGYRPGEGAVVGELEGATERVVQALLPGKDRHLVKVGQPVRIWLPLEGADELTGRVIQLRSYSEKDLRDSPFSSTVGGELATEVRDGERQSAPLEAQYMCTVQLDGRTATPIPSGLTGRLAIHQAPKTILALIIDAVYITFNRESLI
jgi:putative peptide zinc metalloprotease protein